MKKNTSDIYTLIDLTAKLLWSESFQKQNAVIEHLLIDSWINQS